MSMGQEPEKNSDINIFPELRLDYRLAGTFGQSDNQRDVWVG